MVQHFKGRGGAKGHPVLGPSRVGGARGYDIHTREMMVKLCKSGNPVSQTMICSIQRWADGCDHGPLSPTFAAAVEEDGVPSREDRGIDGGECVGQAEWRGGG
jgi:hypothetical protein